MAALGNISVQVHVSRPYPALDMTPPPAPPAPPPAGQIFPYVAPAS